MLYTCKILDLFFGLTADKNHSNSSISKLDYSMTLCQMIPIQMSWEKDRLGFFRL